MPMVQGLQGSRAYNMKLNIIIPIDYYHNKKSTFEVNGIKAIINPFSYAYNMEYTLISIL
jgi:hypothetical protein